MIQNSVDKTKKTFQSQDDKQAKLALQKNWCYRKTNTNNRFVILKSKIQFEQLLFIPDRVDQI